MHILCFKLSLYKHNCVWVNLKRGKTVTSVEGQTLHSWDENNTVTSYLLLNILNYGVIYYKKE